MQRAVLSAVCVVGLLSHGGSHLGSSRTVDVIRSYGYNAKEYSVVTEDNYVLSLTRIKSSASKLPVLMIHGVIAASDQWVLRGPGKDLALILVDKGHDVWLADQRGNTYSRKHLYLNTSQPEFWDFSYHESGLYDVPAFVDTVLKHSGTKQLHYIGHSMGTSVYYVMCSLRPQYNRVIRSAVHISPIAFGLQKKMTTGIQLMLDNIDGLVTVIKNQNLNEFISRSAVNERLIDDTCSNLNRRMCYFLVSQTYGSETQISDIASLRKYLKRLQSGTSIKTMRHLAQIFISKNFTQFDYGRNKNFGIYYSANPPEYPLHKVTSPVALFYGDKDTFIDDHSIARLKNALPNVIVATSIPKYNHIDVLFADNAPTVLFKRIVKLLSKS